MDKCGALIISCSTTDPNDLARQIAGCTASQEVLSISDSIRAYPWHIETKYYIADIHLYACTAKELSEELAHNVEAVVLHFDNNDEKSFQQVQSWMPFLEHYSAEVQLLVCDTCEDNDDVKQPLGVPRKKVLEWCIQNGFELVELYPTELSDDEDDFKETKGLKRIVQALHAHMWPNLTMKEKPNYQPSLKLKALMTAMENESDGDIERLTSDFGNVLAADGDRAEAAVPEGRSDRENAIESKIDALLEEDKHVFDSVASDDPDDRSFEALFERFKALKDKAANLTGEERYLYAERVAMSFWHALGGDDEEVAVDGNKQEDQ